MTIMKDKVMEIIQAVTIPIHPQSFLDNGMWHCFLKANWCGKEGWPASSQLLSKLRVVTTFWHWLSLSISKWR
jgi:hypothetical protein